MKIIPLGDRVLLSVALEETTTKSGIIIPDTATQEKTQTGTVIAIGDSSEITVKKGQKVLYEKYSGSQIEIDKTEHLVIASKDILAIIN